MNEETIEILISCVIPHFSFGRCCFCRYLIRADMVDENPKYCQKFEEYLEDILVCPRWDRAYRRFADKYEKLHSESYNKMLKKKENERDLLKLKPQKEYDKKE